jgi:hypothetical protein
MIEAIKRHLSRKNKGMSADEVEARAQQILTAYQQAQGNADEAGEAESTAAFERALQAENDQLAFEHLDATELREYPGSDSDED